MKRGGGASPWTRSSDGRLGRGHLALATLYRAGKAPAVITQNIDNLHQSSGISAEHVIELHGNNSFASCLDCGKRYELDWVRERFVRERERAPDCPTAVDISRPPPSPSVRRCPSARCGARSSYFRLRSLPRGRLLVGGMAGGRLPAAREAKRGSPGDHQSRRDRIRCDCRPGCSRRHRIGAIFFHHPLISAPV